MRVTRRPRNIDDYFLNCDAKRLRADAERDALLVRAARAQVALDADPRLLADQPNPKGWRGYSLRQDTLYLLDTGNVSCMRTAAVRVEAALKVPA